MRKIEGRRSKVETERSTMLLLLCALCASVVPGCGDGRFAPEEIKTSFFTATADGIVALEKIDAGTEPPESAAEALRRMIGTKAATYEDGDLAPVGHYFRGTKPPPKPSEPDGFAESVERFFRDLAEWFKPQPQQGAAEGGDGS